MSRDLFSDSADAQLESVAPLAQRLRPHTLDEFVGQSGIVGENSALRRAIAADRVPSMIFYGPPGSGKTTLARIVASTTQAHFEELSAVQVGVGDVRRVLGEARDRLGGNGRRTILFLDEIHRFNKGQQDALLPAVESGLLTLIGATTENPYFEVNSALLSRCQLFELMPLAAPDLEAIVRRGEATLRVELEPDLRDEVVRAAGGDARSALNILDAAVASAAGGPVTEDHVRDAARKQPLLYDKGGDRHYDTTSAFIKSMRGSDADAALYYMATMITAGEDPKFIARRMIVFASEDVGNADPQALQVAVAAARAVEFVGLPECRINLAQAAVYLARAPKSNAVKSAYFAARIDAEETARVPVPLHLRNAVTPLMKHIGYGKDYRYVHSDPSAKEEMECLPEQLHGHKYFSDEDPREEQTKGEEIED